MRQQQFPQSGLTFTSGARNDAPPCPAGWGAGGRAVSPFTSSGPRQKAEAMGAEGAASCGLGLTEGSDFGDEVWAEP